MPVETLVPDIPDRTAMVEACERLLEDAKSGRLRGLAMVTLLTDGETGSGWFGGARDNLQRTLGALCILNDRILKEFRT